MTEYRQMFALLLSIVILCCVAMSVVSRANAQPEPPQPDAQSETVRERFPGHIRETDTPRTPHRLTSYTMESHSEFTDKDYIHNEAFHGKNVYNGVDISAKQNGINWIVLSQHIDFAFIRAGYRGYTEGVTHVDRLFHTNMRCAEKMGVKKGVYFYSQAINSDEIREEASLMLKSIAPYTIELPVVLDFEYAEVGAGLGGRLHEAKLTREQVTEMCRVFCEAVEFAGYTPMIYANSHMMRNMIDENGVNCAIWIAYPGTENGYEGRYTCWQYSWAGRIPGIRGDVDCNYIYADELSCEAFKQPWTEEVNDYASF